VTLAILMVSTIRIPSLKDVKLPKNGIITTAFVVYLIYLFTGVKPENIPLSFYVVLIIYVAFISVRFIKEKEPKFKKPKWIKIRRGSGKIILKKKK
jgi:CDP-diacylglycerol--serine O-phosphatidyltransferase